MKLFAVTVLMVTLGASQALIDTKPPADPAYNSATSPTCFYDCAVYKASGYCEASWGGCNSALAGKKVKDFCQASCAPEPPKDLCNPNPCQNGGTCNNGACTCPAGCSGATCGLCTPMTCCAGEKARIACPGAFAGMTEQQCHGLGQDCCWDTSRKDVPWCHQKAAASMTCEEGKKARNACPGAFGGMTEQQCDGLGQGCCWDTSRKDVPWCFSKEQC